MSTKGRGRKNDDTTLEVLRLLALEAERQEVTHDSISERSGVPRSTVTKLFNDLSALDVSQLFLLCKALGLSAADVLAEAERRVAESRADTQD